MTSGVMWCIGSNSGRFGLGDDKVRKELTKAEWTHYKPITNIIGGRARILSTIFEINKEYYSSPSLLNDEDYNATLITYFKENNINDIIKCIEGWIFVSKQNEIYSTSRLYYDDNDDDDKEDNKVKFFKTTFFKENNLKIKQITACVVALVLCENGLVYSIGGNDDENHNYGQTGNGKKTLNEWTVINKLKNIKISQIAMSLFGSVFVSESGSVWVCGDNQWGYLGLGHKNKNDGYPEEITYFSKNHIKIINVVCGPEYTLLLDNNHNVYAFGANSCGQCGDGTTEDILSPKLIFKNINYISCGSGHSLLKSIDNKYYMFGANFCGQSLSEKLMEKEEYEDEDEDEDEEDEDVEEDEDEDEDEEDEEDEDDDEDEEEEGDVFANVLSPQCVNEWIYSKTNNTGKILQIEVYSSNTMILIGNEDEKKEEFCDDIDDDDEKQGIKLQKALIIINDEFANFEKSFKPSALNDILKKNEKEISDSNSNLNKKMAAYKATANDIITNTNKLIKYIETTRNEIDKLSKPNPSNYKSWSISQILIWIKNLESGRFIPYIDKLEKGFNQCLETGQDLPDIDKNELVNKYFDIKSIKIRKDLANYFKKLAINEGTDGNATAYI